MTEPLPVPPIVPPPTPSTIHVLPPPFAHTPLPLQPLTQGAEALLYITTFLTPSTRAVLKYRPPKPYRHPILDKRLTKQRLLAEARSLVKVKREGLNVPGVLGVDAEGGWLVLEYIEGGTVRGALDGWAAGRAMRKTAGKEGERGEGMDQNTRAGREEREEEITYLMQRVGQEVGKLHALGVCHGDLTTSNIMVRTPDILDTQSESESAQPQAAKPSESLILSGRQTASSLREAAMNGPPPSSLPPTSQFQFTSPPSPSSSLRGAIYLIDFGLTTSSIQDEDKAVDLYVLERAFSATHPAAEGLFQEVLKAYSESYKGGRAVLRRLEDVRLRGRKRSMLG